MPGLPTFLRRLARLIRPAAAEAGPPDYMLFMRLTFEGAVLHHVSGKLKGSDPPLLQPGLAGADLPALLGPGAEALADPLAALLRDGTPFALHLDLPDAGMIRVCGQTEGVRAMLYFGLPGPGEKALAARLIEADAAAAELARMRLRAESSPVAAFENDAGGRLVWQNAAAAQILGTGAAAARTAAEIRAAGEGTRQLGAPDGGSLGWGRVSIVPGPDGRTITHVQDIGGQHRAEQALKSFVSALTDTFAHLDVALAVFDREQRLALFNPALSELTGLAAPTLAARPSLREFLEALRQRRMIPEPDDYTLWRRRLTERLGAPGAKPWSEDWVLPSGQTLRLTARPQPGGASALIFADITDSVMMERRYRAEIESGQATLDGVAEAVAIFGRSGDVLFANDAFERTLGFDAFTSLLPEGVEALIARISARRAPDPGWYAFRDYALAQERLDRWDRLVDGGAEGRLLLRASALPDGSTLLAVHPEARRRAAPTDAPPTATLAKAAR